MSQHPSLRIDSVGRKHRNVLSRLEKIKALQGQGKWEDRKSIFGLPKVKSMKIKIKKVQEVAGEAEAAAAGGTTPAAKAAPAGKAPPVAAAAKAAPAAKEAAKPAAKADKAKK